MKNNNIPIIEAVPKKGYWAIYQNRKVWHDESDWNKMKFKEYDTVAEKYNMGGDWLNLEQGENKVRLVSEFEDYGTHYDQKANKSVVCIGKENCAYCKAGDKPRVQFLGWAIDRKDGKVKLLRFGHSIFKQIGSLAKFGDYAFESVPEYDITIIRKGEGLDTEYSVLPDRKNTPLSDQEQAMIRDKIKPAREIIDNMKAKVLPEGTIPVADRDVVEPPKEEIDPESIPF